MARLSRETELHLLAVMAAVAVPVAAAYVVLLSTGHPAVCEAAPPPALPVEAADADLATLFPLRPVSLEAAPPPTGPRRLLAEFPSRLSGAARVSKVPVEGARCCLVHIRQMHHTSNSLTGSASTWAGRYSAAEVRQALREQYRQISAVQRDIYRILYSLARSHGVRGVYAEGLHEGVVSLEDVRWYYSHIREQMTETCGLAPLGRHAADDPAERAARYVPGAELVLAMEGVIELRPGESRTLLRRVAATCAAYRAGRLGTCGYRQVVLEEREDEVLKRIAASGEPLAVVVYGAAHSWRDNVERWNRRSPHFSLIEITPASYLSHDPAALTLPTPPSPPR